MPKADSVSYKDLYDAVDEMRRELTTSIKAVEKSVTDLEKTTANMQGKSTGMSTAISGAIAVFSFFINVFVLRKQ